MTDRILAALLFALVVVGAVFALWPELDLAVTHYVYINGHFLGDSATARIARDVLRYSQFVLLGVLLLLWCLRLRTKRTPAPSLAALVFLGASFAVGSGLIVNLGLKDHSHRPRPVHLVEFGGKMEFRPWNRFDGACVKNCAFASGEAASGAWMMAPALLAPPPFQGIALIGAILYAVAASALRVAAGAHFLSDVLIGGLISAIVVMAMWRVYLRLAPRRPRENP